MTVFLPLNHAWHFCRLTSDGNGPTTSSVVDLPHVPFVADLDGRAHWFGECEYERLIALPPNAPAGPCVLYLGAAMHSAVVSIDGVELGRHAGGYLPFEVDLTQALRDGKMHRLSVRLDNRDNAEVPPGKPYAELDFCWYGGLYRNAELRCYPMVYIPDAVEPNVIGGGGVFVRTISADEKAATLNVKVRVNNADTIAHNIQLQVEILYGSDVVAQVDSVALTVGADTSISHEVAVELVAPRLWHLETPALYSARITVRSALGDTLDVRLVRFGIRRISFSRSGGFILNGRRLRLRGTNRHQEFPRVGYAAPRAAQYRDARRIKEAGFDYVRLSHYPQSPDFLDACDELGLVIMNCIPGWQFLGGARFRDAVYTNARQLIRRDRNHASVILWELCLNETPMDDEILTRLHAIGHEEYPGDQMYTCGWLDRFDVFSHARQHGKIHSWRNGEKALVVAEYGDWEFYARNKGFDQKSGAGVYDPWSTSRQFRADGERGLVQQAQNHCLALNDTLSSPAVLDGQWAIFDYARGYHPVRAATGVMDIFRLPKYSYYFYRSQRNAAETGSNWTGGPMVFIASHWTSASALRLNVFSNCEEVALHLNDRLIGRARPSQSSYTQHLPHPPFVFDLVRFEPGRLKAVGYIGQRPVATHSIATPGAISQLELIVDDAGIRSASREPDVLCVHARLCDASGTLCVEENPPVEFYVEGAELVGPSILKAEAGIASIVARIASESAALTITARICAVTEITPVTQSWTREKGPGVMAGITQILPQSAHCAIATTI